MFFLGDLDSKTGRPVMDVLRYKHPALYTHDLSDPKCSSFEDYAEDPDIAPIDISEEYVMWLAGKLSGAADPNGTDAKALQSWILNFGQAIA